MESRGGGSLPFAALSGGPSGSGRSSTGLGRSPGPLMVAWPVRTERRTCHGRHVTDQARSHQECERA